MPEGFAGFVVLVIVLSALVVLLRAGAAQASRRETFWTVCPSGLGAVHCTLLRDGDTGLWKDVVHCSAFADPELVTCRKICLKLANQALEGKAEG